MSDGSRPVLNHMGIFVRDLPAMERFYTQVFGLLVTDRGVGKTFKNELVFLSASAEHHHQLVLSAGRPSEGASTVMQLSFKVDALSDLRALKAAAVAWGCQEMVGLNHGNAWSVYFNDPEENRVEIYMDTPFHTPQPCGEPIDIDCPEAQLLRETRELIAGLQGSKSRADYVAEMADMLSQPRF